MSIQLQLLNLILTIAIVIMWSIFKKFDCYDSKYFKIVLTSLVLASISSFVCALLGTNLFENLTKTINVFIKLSNIFNNILVFVLCTYVYGKIVSKEKHKAILFPMAAIPLIEAIILLILPIQITNNQSLVINGDSIIYSYLFILIYVLLILALFYIYRKKTNKIQKISLGFIVLCFVVSVAIQYLTKTFGIMQLGSTIVVGGCVLLLDNPFNKTNKQYGCFDCSYLNTYVNDYYKNKREGFCAYVTIQSKLINNTSEEKMAQFKKALIKEFKFVPELTTFLTSEKDIFVVCSNPKIYEDFVEDLKEDVIEKRKQLDIDSTYKTVIVFGKNILAASNSESIYRYMHIMSTKGLSSNKTLSVLYLNEKFIDLQEDEKNVRKMIVDALNSDNIMAYYQPIYNAKKAKFTSAEALVRIKDENGNVILPRRFIKTAENTGLIIDIGQKMFEKVCDLLTNPKMKDISLERIDINLSLIECENPNLASNLIKTAKKYQINPSMINFDITEANLEVIYNNMYKNIKKLHDFGFKISLDDFGTKDTKLNYLNNIPISCVKIDRHVVWDYFDNYKTKLILKNLIKLCLDLNIEVSATGIEKITQLNEMANLGVDYIQGYYFFKPMIEEEFMKFLKPNAFQVDEMAIKLQNIAVYEAEK